MNNQPPPNYQEQDAMQLPCARCKSVLTIPKPQMILDNGSQTTMLLFLNPRNITCPNCFEPLSLHVVGIGDISLGYGLVPDVRRKSAGNIVLPPGPLATS